MMETRIDYDDQNYKLSKGDEISFSDDFNKLINDLVNGGMSSNPLDVWAVSPKYVVGIIRSKIKKVAKCNFNGYVYIPNVLVNLKNHEGVDGGFVGVHGWLKGDVWND